MMRLRQVIISLTLTLIIATPVLATDQYETEPNNSITSANSVSATNTYYLYGQLMNLDDEDWYSIRITEPGLLTIGIAIPDDPREGLYLYKHVYNPNGQLIGGNNGQTTLSVYTAEAGTYFIKIWNDGYYPIGYQYAATILGSNVSSHCPTCGLFTEDDLTASYSQGYSDGIAAVGTMYTQEEMDQKISEILTWGDTNGDGKIGLQEAINALQITVGQ